MPRFQKNDNFIDKTFTVIADIVLKNEPNRISALTNKAIALKMLKEYEANNKQLLII